MKLSQLAAWSCQCGSVVKHTYSFALWEVTIMTFCLRLFCWFFFKVQVSVYQEFFFESPNVSTQKVGQACQTYGRIVVWRFNTSVIQRTQSRCWKVFESNIFQFHDLSDRINVRQYLFTFIPFFSGLCTIHTVMSLRDETLICRGIKYLSFCTANVVMVSLSIMSTLCETSWICLSWDVTTV